MCNMKNSVICGWCSINYRFVLRLPCCKPKTNRSQTWAM